MKKSLHQEINSWMEELGWVETQNGKCVSRDPTRWSFGHSIEEVPAPAPALQGMFKFMGRKVPVQYYFFDDTNDALMFKLAWGGNV